MQSRLVLVLVVVVFASATDWIQNAFNFIGESESPYTGRRSRMAYAGYWDPVNKTQRLTVFGGINGSVSNGADNYLNDGVDIIQVSGGQQFRPFQPGGNFTFGEAPAAAVSDDGYHVYIFGGRNNGTYYNRIIIYNTTGYGYGTLNNAFSFSPDATRPPGRAYHTLTYVMRNGYPRLVMFGGLNSSTVLTDSTQLNDVTGGGWVESAANTGNNTRPTPRAGHNCIWVNTTNSVVLYGGKDISGVVQQDVWVYNVLYDTWAPVFNELTGAGLFGASASNPYILGTVMVYMPITGLALLAAGSNNANEQSNGAAYTFDPNATSPSAKFNSHMTNVTFSAISYVYVAGTNTQYVWLLGGDYVNNTAGMVEYSDTLYMFTSQPTYSPPTTGAVTTQPASTQAVSTAAYTTGTQTIAAVTTVVVTTEQVTTFNPPPLTSTSTSPSTSSNKVSAAPSHVPALFATLLITLGVVIFV